MGIALGNSPAPHCERRGESAVRAFLSLPIHVFGIYLLMIGALLLLSAPYTADIGASIAGLGAVLGGYMVRSSAAQNFEASFSPTTWGGSSHVHYGWLVVTLSSVMFTLFLVTQSGD